MLNWLDNVKETNYDGAHHFLTLYYNEKEAHHLCRILRQAPLSLHRVNDILRAANSEPGSVHDPGVRKRLVMSVKGEPISPVLLRSLKQGLMIIDGYHRISMCYYLDPFMDIPAKLID